MKTNLTTRLVLAGGNETFSPFTIDEETARKDVVAVMIHDTTGTATGVVSATVADKDDKFSMYLINWEPLWRGLWKGPVWFGRFPLSVGDKIGVSIRQGVAAVNLAFIVVLDDR